MKTIHVVAAVIKKDHKIFATQRGYGTYQGGWEFPGGKVEAKETAEEALKREIMEELELNIFVGQRIETIEYDYPDFHLSMDCFWCEAEDEPVLKEHIDAKWLEREELYSVNWLPPDRMLIDMIGKCL